MPAASVQPQGEIVVHVFGRTDVGRTREHNEDCFAVADLARAEPEQMVSVHTQRVGERGALFMVADGMGGAAAGELASAMAVDIVLRELRALWVSANDAEPETFATALRSATESANAAIHDYASRHPENRGMGTTATLAGLLGDTLYLTQVGDSRAYLVRAGVARQITKDQSLMQKLIEAGEMTEEEAEQSERRNIILQALGPEAHVRIDLTHQRIRRGDILVLCSDGLSGQVRADEIGRVAERASDLEEACDKLIRLANDNGGPDNITVVVARFEGEGLELPGMADEVGHRVFPLGGDETPTIPMERLPESLSTTAPFPTAGSPDDASRLEAEPADTGGQRRLLIAMVVVLVILAIAAVVLRVTRDEPRIEAEPDARGTTVEARG